MRSGERGHYPYRRQSIMDNTTAKVSSFARAYHFENNKTHIFADSMAKKILGDDYDQIAESMMQGISFFLLLGMTRIVSRM